MVSIPFALRASVLRHLHVRKKSENQENGIRNNIRRSIHSLHSFHRGFCAHDALQNDPCTGSNREAYAGNDPLHKRANPDPGGELYYPEKDVLTRRVYNPRLTARLVLDPPDSGAYPPRSAKKMESFLNFLILSGFLFIILVFAAASYVRKEKAITKQSEERNE